MNQNLVQLSRLLTTVLFASTSVHAGPGFFGTQQNETPAIIAQSAKAVYRYVLLVDPPYVYQQANYDAVIAVFSKGDFAKRLVAEEVKSCKEKNLAQCEFRIGGTGTAFITGANHDRLITAKHNLHYDMDLYKNYLETAESNSLHIWIGNDQQLYQRNMPLNFMLYDQNGKKVFDTRNKGDYGRPEVMGYGKMVNWVKGLLNETPVDFVSIQLSRAVGNTSLILREDRAAPGEELSVIGFPRDTTSRKELDHQPDSDGNAQYYSSGPVAATSEVIQFFDGPQYIPNPKGEAELDKTMLFTSSEAVEGFSGSPVIDEKGRVAGLLVGDWSMTDPTKYMQRNAILLNSRWLLENLKNYAP